jgi:hypothetical protein
MKKDCESDQKISFFSKNKLILNNQERKRIIDFFSLLLEIDKREKIIKKYET